MSETMLPQIAAKLLELSQELVGLAEQIRWYVPASASRDNPLLEAWNRTGGAAAEVRRAVSNIKEGMQR